MPTVTEIKKGQPRNRGNLWCNYCKRKGHTKEKFWKLNGRPPRDMNRKFSQAHMVAYPSYAQGGLLDGQTWNPQPVPSSYNSQPPLLPPPAHPTTHLPSLPGQPFATPDQQQQVNHLQQQVQSLMVSTASSSSPRSIIGSISQANSSNPPFLSALLSASEKILQSSWILDSGATDHMTPIYFHFISYEPCVLDKMDQTADGTLHQVAGIGSVKLEPIGLLTQVLYVPKLLISLVSFQKLAKMSEYRITFDNFDVFWYKRFSTERLGFLGSAMDSIIYSKNRG